MDSWWLVVGIILFAALVVGSTVVAVYFIAFFDTDIEDIPMKYSCNNYGLCSEDVDGSFNTLGDCIHYCDRASCLSTGGCVADPGNLDLDSLATCESTCTAKRFSCTDEGCKDVGDGNGDYESMATCIANCTTWDVDSFTGKCGKVSLPSNGKAIYENQGQCESAEYTSTCDFETSTCTADNKKVFGNNKVSDCKPNCNPNKYIQCGPCHPYALDGVDKYEACADKSEGDACGWSFTDSDKYYDESVYGKCVYCVSDENVDTQLSCQCLQSEENTEECNYDFGENEFTAQTSEDCYTDPNYWSKGNICSIL